MAPDNSHSSNLSIKELLETFSSDSARKRRAFIPLVEERIQEFIELGPSLMDAFDPDDDDWGAGWILQVIYKNQPTSLTSFLNENSKGWFNTPSSIGIDYSLLQQKLVEQDFEEADRLTSSILRQLAGQVAVDRGYIYFSEVNSISQIDLVTLDRLWVAYSQSRFGFSVQKRLLASLGGKYEKLWPRIGWKIDGIWTRYPSAFKWSLEAPEGHMPLVNQLRGVRLMDTLLNHPAFKSRK